MPPCRPRTCLTPAAPFSALRGYTSDLTPAKALDLLSQARRQRQLRACAR